MSKPEENNKPFAMDPQKDDCIREICNLAKDLANPPDGRLASSTRCNR